ncbi:MAG: hypothetical protein BZY67_02665 [SAR202 cluster bacterium Io17-Chloro-G1]|nr:MAG: hypothetical protein BZY67_02665 [SAR202 cluster bacterium Io17-Chloro-G1]
MIAQGCSFVRYELPIIFEYEAPVLLLIHLGISTVATENQVSGRLHPVAKRVRLRHQKQIHKNQESKMFSRIFRH